MNFWKLLDGAADTANTANTANPWQSYMVYILLGVILVLLVVWLLFSGKKNKQRQKEYIEQLDALGPGNKVKTAGGICGIVVEVCDDNTVIIETGSEQSGKSYIKMDKELIAQTDAKGPTQIAREQAEAARKAEKEAKSAEKAARDPDKAPELPAENADGGEKGGEKEDGEKKD